MAEESVEVSEEVSVGNEDVGANIRNTINS